MAVDAGSDGPRMVVEHAGMGLPPTQLARLGERFFRPPRQTASGSGLGWSIVHRIAAVHGLAIAVDRSPTLGGLRVVVSGGAAR